MINDINLRLLLATYDCYFCSLSGNVCILDCVLIFTDIFIITLMAQIIIIDSKINRQRL